MAAVGAVLLAAAAWAANYLVARFGVTAVPFTGLYAPAGVWVVGAAFLLRDVTQRLGSTALAVAAVLAGTGAAAVSASAHLAGASALAFLASELVGLGIFAVLRGRTAAGWGLLAAVACSSAAAAAVDSAVFLERAFGSLRYFDGQLVAKVAVTLLAVPVVVLARRRGVSRMTR